VDLPLILAGPILRRAEPGRVCVWIATSKPVLAKGYVYRKSREREKNALGYTALEGPIGLGNALSVQLGARLHVSIVPVLPTAVAPAEPPYAGASASEEASTPLLYDAFPVGEILFYDVELVTDATSGRGDRLGKTELAPLGQWPITYGDFPLPSFTLAGGRTFWDFLHGSCRKLHGPEEDCLEASDQLIAVTANDPTARPVVLFLTGDQIYADDVSPLVIGHIAELGKEMLGASEGISGLPALHTIPVNGRGALLRPEDGITSEEKDNHLLGFGEYAAMYLMAWSRDVWPRGFDAALSDVLPERARRYGWAGKIADHKESLERTRTALPAVRRALANVPTYMIFDDHDVTDDWNLTQVSYTAMRKSVKGRRILVNALLAYWAFQGWGNEPDAFDRRFVDGVEAYLRARRGEGAGSRVSPQEFEDSLLSFSPWSYSLTTAPRTIVLDTRTQRQYDSPKGAPRLLNAEARAALRRACEGATSGIVVISPAPVLGFELLEGVQKLLAKVAGPYAFDLETWRANPQGFLELLRELIVEIGARFVVFLSGDVHYSFNVSARMKIGRYERELDVVQLTSSPLKNASAGQASAFTAAGFVLPPSDARLCWEFPPHSERLEQLGRELMQLPRDSPEWAVQRELMREIEDEVEGRRYGRRPTGFVQLTPLRARELGITTAADWEEERSYLAIGSRGLPALRRLPEIAGGKGPTRTLDQVVLGVNSLGLVRVEGGGDLVRHTLFEVDGRDPPADGYPLGKPKLRANTAAIPTHIAG